MANVPALNAVVTVTSLSLAGDSVAKQYNAVSAVNFDYAVGKVNIVDVTGSFYFPLIPTTVVTCTIVAGVDGQATWVIS